ncbi:MAG: response regulator [Candidatus Wallbacteria bacterium]|nr:response regulator [Candidatus Wallbacteria bacterium]
MAYSNPILVVDDSELALEMGKDLLDECGFKSIATLDPLTVEGHLRNSPVEIMLLDMLMPNKNGLEVIRDIRAIEPELGRQIMIFVITGLQDRQMALEALRAGAYFYMTKPLRKEALLPSLQSCIAQLEQSRDPATLDASRALRDRISAARTGSSAAEIQLRQPEIPNAYPHPIMIVGGEDPRTGAMAIPMLTKGYHVLECPRSDNMLVLFGSHPVDIVVLNVRLPLEPMSRICEQLRSASLAVRRRLSLIVLVEPGQEGWQKQLQSMGATMCMPRPVDEPALLQTVDWAARRALGL